KAQAEGGGPEAFFERSRSALEKAQEDADDSLYEVWAEILDALDAVRNRDQIFLRPDMLNYISSLQERILASGAVGKSNSVSDVVKKVHQELYEGKIEKHSIPDTINAVSQCLISFQGSHKPDDLYHLVTPDYSKANLWVQLKSGDNKDMETLIHSVKEYFASNPPPVPLSHKWAGLTYINVVWQDKMVTGMSSSFMGSFVIVLIMMIVLFRSLLWGLLAMIPLTVTITLIYGVLGLIGKDYDMPVAVLSSLTLGLAVDFAIHFLLRTRMAYQELGSWSLAINEMFAEPAQAISRNIIVIAVGFTPLLAAPLVPYKTVGVFLASIMAISGVSTMFILPALITLLERFLFKNRPLTIPSEGEKS
ncbi:MAG: MMPL family transporter, partial [Planctomycetes bacterium]|nr:MMPL family transporter [Planctomycetota bacterium]